MYVLQQKSRSSLPVALAEWPPNHTDLSGSTLSDGSYRVDELARDSLRRGGGGGEGALGVRFDIINGTPDPKARDKVAMRAGPRVTLNKVEKELLHPTDGWGDIPGGMCIDVINGRDRLKHVAPERSADVPVRFDTAVGRTRPW